MLTFDEYVKLAASYADYVASRQKPAQNPTPEPAQNPTPEPAQNPTPEPVQNPTPEPVQKPEWIDDIMRKLDSMQVPKPNMDNIQPITTVDDVVKKILNGR